MARDEGISELKTETFDGIKSIIESIIDYAANNNREQKISCMP